MDEECGVFTLIDDSKPYTVKIVIDKDMYLVYGILAELDEDNISAVAEYLLRANCLLRYGAFQLDYNEYLVRFMVYCDCGNKCDSMPSYSVVDQTINMPRLLFMSFGKSLLSVINGEATPAEALNPRE